MVALAPELALETRDLRVDYGNLLAVAGIDLAVPKGCIYGLVGPNGAGKSSTIRVLATLQERTYGHVRVGGIDTMEHPAEVHKILGYMPDLAPLIPELKVEEFLHYFAAAYGLQGATKKARVDLCLEKVGMQDKREVFCKTLSRGMSQRVVLAKTLLHQPSVLLLDEPASGMDPIARLQLRDTLMGLRDEGATVLLSSHILTELADISTEVGIMHQGKLLASGQVDAVVAEWSTAQRVVAIDLLDAGQTEDARTRLKDAEGVEDVVSEAGGPLLVSFAGDDAAMARLLNPLVTNGIGVTGFAEKRGSIEDVMRAIAPEGGEVS